MQNILQKLSQEFQCPIINVPIEDPVIASDGHTYQRQAIQNWFKRSQCSPLTGLVIESKNLIPNIAMKKIKQKIVELIPQLFQHAKYLSTQNEELKNTISEMKEDLAYERELKKSKSIELEQIMKQVKIEQRRGRIKNDRLTKQKIKIHKLTIQNRNLKKKLLSLTGKSEIDEQSQKSKIEQLTKKLQNQQKQHKQKMQKILTNLNATVNTVEQFAHNSVKESFVMLYSLMNRIQDSTGTEKENLIVLQRLIEKNFESRPQYLSAYKMNRFLVSCLVNGIGNSKYFHLLVPKFYLQSSVEYWAFHNVIAFETILLIEENMKEKAINQEDYKQFRKLVEGVVTLNHKAVNDKNWQKFIKLAPKYPNIQSITLIDSQIKNMNRNQLEQFPNLKYLNLTNNVLNKDSFRQLFSYKIENPLVIVIGIQQVVQINLPNIQRIDLMEDENENNMQLN